MDIGLSEFSSFAEISRFLTRSGRQAHAVAAVAEGLFPERWLGAPHGKRLRARPACKVQQISGGDDIAASSIWLPVRCNL